MKKDIQNVDGQGVNKPPRGVFKNLMVKRGLIQVEGGLIKRGP